MESLWFWLMAAALAAAVAAVFLRSLLQAQAGATGRSTALADLGVYRDQLAEADRDLARGTLAATEAQRLKTEIARRILEADRALAAEGAAPARMRRSLALPALVATLACGGALALYARIGAPGYEDLPIASRIAAADAAMAGRPSQADYLASQGLAPLPADVAAARAAADAAPDADALRRLVQERFLAQDQVTAEAAERRLLDLLGDGATSSDHATLALILTLQARGYVSPEAETALRAALTQNPNDELALYLLGEMLIQGGRFDLAFRFWRPLAEQGDPAAPWTAEIRAKIGDLAYLAGVDYSLPEAATSPDAGDIAAAGEMAAEDRQAMVEGMVEQLQDRLAREGGSAEEWAKLINALGVLERRDEAQRVYDEAKGRFAGRTADLAALAAAAGAAGLQP